MQSQFQFPVQPLAVMVFATASVRVSVTVENKKQLGPQPPPPPRQGGEHVFNLVGIWSVRANSTVRLGSPKLYPSEVLRRSGSGGSFLRSFARRRGRSPVGASAGAKWSGLVMLVCSYMPRYSFFLLCIANLLKFVMP